MMITHVWKRLASVTALMFMLCGSLTSAPALAAEACFSDWSVAASVVREHELVPVDKLSSLARSKASSRLVQTQLCQSKDGFHYKLVLRGLDGKLKKLRVNAKSPFTHGGMVQ